MFRYLVAFVLIMHGLAHLSGFLEAWTPVQAFATRPWLFSEGVTMHTVVGRVFGLLWLVVARLVLLAFVWRNGRYSTPPPMANYTKVNGGTADGLFPKTILVRVLLPSLRYGSKI